MQSNIPVPDFLQTTAFCTEELKTNKTRPYFKKTLILSKNGNTCGKWNLTKANAKSSASCPTSKVLTASYFLHGQTLETTSASKYLGITISSDLSWPTHVEDVAARWKPGSGVPVKELQGRYSKS